LIGLSDSFRALRQRLQRVPRHAVQIALPKLAVAGAVVAPDLLHEKSVVYSVSPEPVSAFDRALIEHFGCTVHTLKYTPHPPRRRDDTLPLHISPDATKAIQPDAPELWVLARMQRSMLQLDQRHIDLLRLDLEGAEYNAIDALAQTALRPCQLVVDFHHHMPHCSFTQTERALTQLNDLGYRIFGCHASGQEYSLALV
jgi:Methyltransferase FkbM domain